MSRASQGISLLGPDTRVHAMPGGRPVSIQMVWIRSVVDLVPAGLRPGVSPHVPCSDLPLRDSDLQVSPRLHAGAVSCCVSHLPKTANCPVPVSPCLSICPSCVSAVGGKPLGFIYVHYPRDFPVPPEKNTVATGCLAPFLFFFTSVPLKEMRGM